MRVLSLLGALSTTFLAACSLVNAPGEVVPPATGGTGGTGGAGGTGGVGGGGTGGMPAMCGNGVVEDTEQCDDGNMSDTDACTKACKVKEFVVVASTDASGDEFPGVGLTGADVSRFFVVWRHYNMDGSTVIQGITVNEQGGVLGTPAAISTVANPGRARVATIRSMDAPDRGKSIIAFHGPCNGGQCSTRYRIANENGALQGATDKAGGGFVQPNGLITPAASVANSFALAWDAPDASGQVQTKFQAITPQGQLSGSILDLGGLHPLLAGVPGLWSSKAGFVAAWDSGDGFHAAQEVAPNGNPLSAIFQLCTLGPCTGADGAFVGPNDQFLSVFSEGGAIKKRAFTAPGTPAEAVAAVSTQAQSETDARVARFDQRTIVVWADGSKGADCNVRARLFDANGVPLGLDFQVNELEDPNGVPPPRCQGFPNVAINDAGDVLVVWDDYNILGNPPGPPFRVSAKLYPGLMTRPLNVFFP